MNSASFSINRLRLKGLNRNDLLSIPYPPMARKLSTSAAHPLADAWARALRDVLIASINKGQFPVAILGLVLLALIVKMPAEDVSKLVFRLIERDSLLGYFVPLLLLVGWYVHSRYQRRAITREIERMAAERNVLQSKSLGQQRIKSSKGRP